MPAKRKRVAKRPSPKKGHWPAGKRRHKPHHQWGWAISLGYALLVTHRLRRVRSIRAVAAALEVAPRTVSRWLAGEDIPSPDRQTAFLRWVRRHRPDEGG